MCRGPCRWPGAHRATRSTCGSMWFVRVGTFSSVVFFLFWCYCSTAGDIFGNDVVQNSSGHRLRGRWRPQLPPDIVCHVGLCFLFLNDQRWPQGTPGSPYFSRVVWVDDNSLIARSAMHFIFKLLNVRPYRRVTNFCDDCSKQRVHTCATIVAMQYCD